MRPSDPRPECTTPGCPGDGRYAAPGRHHVPACRYPIVAPSRHESQPTQRNPMTDIQDYYRDLHRESLTSAAMREGLAVLRTKQGPEAVQEALAVLERWNRILARLG